jgi:uncharacterized protein
MVHALLSENDNCLIGITGPSHQAIANAVETIVEYFEKKGDSSLLRAGYFKIPKEISLPDSVLNVLELRHVKMRNFNVIASTPWPIAKAVITGEVYYSTIFIDEAGQIEVGKALVCSIATSQLVLLGDPQQLPHIMLNPFHPEGTKVSSLGHVMGEDRVVGDAHGVFLDTTWRMHPDICSYISENFYDGKLESHENCSQQYIEGVPQALNLVRVAHRKSRRRKSIEEANAIVNLTKDLLDREWKHAFESEVQRIKQQDIIVVSPYRDQVSLIKRLLKREGLDDIEVGTVNKFQGREAAVVIYSLATSSLSDARRGQEFLLDRNRTNVAVSRARAAVFLVASELLISEIQQVEMDAAIADFTRRAENNVG